jgi:hypothetical protein
MENGRLFRLATELGCALNAITRLLSINQSTMNHLCVSPFCALQLEDLSHEMENGRLFRLATKLSFVTEFRYKTVVSEQIHHQ